MFLFPLEFSCSKKSDIPINLCPAATARYSLVTLYRQPDASLSPSKTLSQIQNPHGHFYRLKLRFLSFIKKIWFRISVSVKRWAVGQGSSATVINLRSSYVRKFIYHINCWVWCQRIINFE